MPVTAIPFGDGAFAASPKPSGWLRGALNFQRRNAPVIDIELVRRRCRRRLRCAGAVPPFQDVGVLGGTGVPWINGSARLRGAPGLIEVSGWRIRYFTARAPVKAVRWVCLLVPLLWGSLACTAAV